MKQYAEKLGEQVDDIVRKTALNVFSSLVQKSPVATGRFRGNWQIGIGAINSKDDSPDDKLPLKSNPDDTNKRKAIDALKAYRGEIIYISNSLKYAQRLEDGYSKKQAPAGMARLTVVEFDTIFKNATK